jgi:PAS domain S-box-containing protein
LQILEEFLLNDYNVFNNKALLPMLKKIFSLHLKVPLFLFLNTTLSIVAIFFETKYLFSNVLPNNFRNWDFILAASTVFVISIFCGLVFSISTTSLLEKISNSAKKILENQYDFQIKNRPRDEIGETIENFERLRLWIATQSEDWKEEKNKAEAILHNIGDGVMAVDLKGIVFLFNSMAENITGLSKSEILGQSFQNFIKFFNHKTGEEVTDMYSTKKARIPVAVVATPIKGQKNLILGSIVVFRDITSEIELERMRTDLISIASHQLRTPLSEIRGLVEILLEGVGGTLNPKQLEFLKDARKATQRMIDLVNDLLNVTRLEQGRLKFNLQNNDISKLANEVYKIHQKDAQEKNQTFTIALPPIPSVAVCDGEKTREVIDNLVSNALKYTLKGGTINLWVQIDDRGVWFSVKDNGIGIPKDKQKSLFQKFSRIPNPLSQELQGTGLGLYAAKQLIEQQNGKIWFESDFNKGSTFAFVMPRAKGI